MLLTDRQTDRQLIGWVDIAKWIVIFLGNVCYCIPDATSSINRENER